MKNIVQIVCLGNELRGLVETRGEEWELNIVRENILSVTKDLIDISCHETTLKR